MSLLRESVAAESDGFERRHFGSPEARRLANEALRRARLDAEWEVIIYGPRGAPESELHAAEGDDEDQRRRVSPVAMIILSALTAVLLAGSLFVIVTHPELIGSGAPETVQRWRDVVDGWLAISSNDVPE